MKRAKPKTRKPKRKPARPKKHPPLHKMPTDTEADCWRKIAAAFRGSRTDATRFGLCYAVRRLVGWGGAILGGAIFNAMNRRLEAELRRVRDKNAEHPYLFPLGQKYRAARATVAERFAAEAETKTKGRKRE